MNDSPPSPGYTWLAFTLLTVLTWGVYGILLHKGQVSMGDPVNGRYKAFLFVGIAYFLTAVLAPLLLLAARGTAFSGYTAAGGWWSLIAGIAGAIGAFGVLLAFGAKGKPPEVMAVVFAGAPVVNSVVSIWLIRNTLDFGPHPWVGWVAAGITAAVGLGLLLLASKLTQALIRSVVGNTETGGVHPLFYVGLVFALTGGALVTLFKPGSPPAKPLPAATRQAAVAPNGKP